MKRNKKWMIGIIIVIVLSVLTIKIYYAIANNNFERRIENMKISGIANLEIKSVIEHKTLQQDGYEIHYYVSGEKDKPAIVFLHPAFSDHTCFDNQIDFFSPDFRVITIDLLGHGLSKAGKSKDKIDKSTEHIRGIMDVEKIEHIHIAGVSMGSLIAQHFALQYPETILSLTALGGYNINHDNKEVQKLQGKEMIGWMFRMIFSMDAFRRYAASVSAINETEQVRFYKSTKGFTRKSFSVMSGLNKLIAERETPMRNYPLLIMAGSKDNELAKELAGRWHKEEPQSTFQIIENAGHCANMDNPESFNLFLYQLQE